MARERSASGRGLRRRILLGHPGCSEFVLNWSFWYRYGVMRKGVPPRTLNLWALPRDAQRWQERYVVTPVSRWLPLRHRSRST